MNESITPEEILTKSHERLFREYRKEIAEEVEDKMLRMGSCPEEMAIILHIIAPEDYERESDITCNDCWNEDCWRYPAGKAVEKVWKKMSSDNNGLSEEEKRAIEILDKYDFSSYLKNCRSEGIGHVMHWIEEQNDELTDAILVMPGNKLMAYIIHRYGLEVEKDFSYNVTWGKGSKRNED